MKVNIRMKLGTFLHVLHWILCVVISTQGSEQISDDILHGLSTSTAKVRHFRRHLDNKLYVKTQHFEGEKIQYKQSSSGSRAVQDNHKPVFTNCSRYAPTVNEEEPSGTSVFRVQAIDRDPLDNGGSLTYTLLSAPQEKVKFSVDPVTGEIKTKTVLDRDEPQLEKEVYITVKASDNGHPSLDDVCTIKITVVDVNDNLPVFDKVIYAESVPQDLQVGREVMRISATDFDDGKNSIVLYELHEKRSVDKGYFRIDSQTGIIYLNHTIDRSPSYKFQVQATATDQGDVPMAAAIDLDINVVESNQKAPSFREFPLDTITIPENLSDYSYNIATLVADSNSGEDAPIFELVTGRTEQTNSLGSFRLDSEKNTAHIRLGRLLDYETNSEYTLTVRIVNKYNLAAEKPISIQLVDVNNNLPTFTKVVSGSVLENEPPGTPVMQVQAIDADCTSANNQVTYELADNTDNFEIDKYTGNITTRKMFDREEKDFYNVKVIATDNSPSANLGLGSGKHNRGEQVFRIEIVDKNDHAPKFTQAIYVAENIPEDANINSLVTEVKAQDNDTASPVQYSIVDGNTNDSFEIEPTGKIRVLHNLDYETVTSYTLRVRTFDGGFEDFCTVEIKITDVNDNRPVFEPYEQNIKIREEETVSGCIQKFEAYDPDIRDRSAPQNIAYFVVKDQDHFSIDQNGCLKLIKPLDRDPPKGSDNWQAQVGAIDENGTSTTSQKEVTLLYITLEDINDNAPYLNMPGPVVWRENQNPGVITTLTAKDNDEPENGEPFTYSISPDASNEIHTKFGVSGNELSARVAFDREEKKNYLIPIAITDSGNPRQTGTSTLTVIIGDQNDNPMKPGKSSIFVYNYRGQSPDTEVGQVYVDDPDDWDLPDKVFNWKDGAHNNFDLNSGNGMITMLEGIHEGSYILYFSVTQESPIIQKHSVDAMVNVTVKVIPDEAVDNSGSFRLDGITAEEFIEPNQKGISKATILKRRLSEILNASLENVDVFTVLHSPHNENQKQLDVRFSARGSPYYYPPERINKVITSHQGQIEKDLGVQILMVNIDECIHEKFSCKNDEISCVNFLNKSNAPYAVYTNTTSFVGVRAVVDPFCKCEAPLRFCYNGGTLRGDTCDCPPNYEGARCEKVSIGFNGEGWALYPTLQSCVESTLSFELRTHKPDGLVFYVGPTSYRSTMSVQDFMSLELIDGFPVLLVDYGTGTTRLEQHQIKLNDGEPHRINIILNKISIELQVDNCKLSNCLILKTPIGPNRLLNVNGPLQLGGTYLNLEEMSRHMNWTYKPNTIPFAGCISNLTFNGKMYNLGVPSLSHNAIHNCGNLIAGTVTFGIDSSFLLAILACCAILLILLLAVIVQRKKTDDSYKDTDDIRENVINYEDQGGGEGDMTGYDLNVLRLMLDAPNDAKLPNGTLMRGPNDEVPDICGFLDGKKHSVDNDPETNPFDDVRHYAYEGDGNTTGSLSSLASVTDEGDLNFDYLSNFGPRFRKLADMYGEDPSDVMMKKKTINRQLQNLGAKNNNLSLCIKKIREEKEL